MEPRQVKTAADARRIVKERGLSHVKVGVHDIDGILRGKYLHVDKFHSALDGGMGFCDVVLGWDANDQLYDNVTYTGWHTGYPDANVRLLPETCREIATEPGNLLFLCEFVDRAEELCPRGVLRRVLARAAEMGFEVKVGFEYEFFVFAETAFSIREKGYKNLKPISPGFFGYSVLRNSVLSDFYRDLLAMCETMDMGIEGLHTETGAGVLEAALRVNDGAAPPPTTPRSSSSSPRCWRRSATGSPPSWPNGRRTGRAAAATCTCRCGRAASRPSTTRRRRTA